jgi:hypothetical protein
MGLVRHVARMEDVANTIFWSENLKVRDHLEELVLYGNIILKWILGKQSGKLLTECRWLRI